jgi:hypothetical protein
MDDLDNAIHQLDTEGKLTAARAFRASLVNVEAVAKQLAPFGQYPVAKTDKHGRISFKREKGGDLRASLRVEYLGFDGNFLRARCSSDLPYAHRQHEEAFHHPGMYSAPVAGVGPVYISAFFSRAVEICFGSGRDPIGDPNGWLNTTPAHFRELLKREQAA